MADSLSPEFREWPQTKLRSIEVRKLARSAGAHVGVHRSEGGHMGPPLQKINYFYDRSLVSDEQSASHRGSPPRLT